MIYSASDGLRKTTNVFTHNLPLIMEQHANTVPDSLPDPLERSMVRLADTCRLVYVIGHRIRNGLSSNEFPDPVLRHYDHIGSNDGSDND